MSPYLRLIPFVLGIVLFSVYSDNFVVFCVAYIMVMQAPVKMYEKFTSRIYADPQTKEGTWKDFPEEKLNELLSYIPSKTSIGRGASESSSSSFLASLFAILVLSGFLFLGPGILLMLEGDHDDAMVMFSIAFVIMIIHTLVHFGGGSPAPHPLCIEVPALRSFQNCNLNGFHKKFEAQIVFDKNKEPDILNARMQIKPDQPIKNFLCMMATISRTNVQNIIYPYAYFVLVFKGSKLANQSTQFLHDFDLLVHNTTECTIEVKTQEGNTVLVVLPKYARLYTTDFYYCQKLAALMERTCDLMNEYKDELEAL